MEMMRKTWIMACLFLLTAGGLIAQNGIHQGMIRVQGTFALGQDFEMEEQRYYIYGEAEYLPTRSIGVNGGIYGMVASNTRPDHPDFEQKDTYIHNMFFGPAFHFNPESRVDPYVMVQPGVAFVHGPVWNKEFDVVDRMGLAPVGSLTAGISYYGSFFHLNAQIRALTGTYADQYFQFGLSELRASFGLGFNL